MAGRSLFFVDTSVLIRHLRQKTGKSVFDTACATFGQPVVSEMVVFELEVGARRAGHTLEFNAHFAEVPTYPLSLEVLLEAADIQATLLKQNQVIGLPDTFIAATAIVHDLPLFSLNTAHFQRIDGLTLLQLS
jgi:tRNA(fMet)-specific endonuclease VapC